MEDVYVLGVDIGGSHIACQLVNLSDCSLIENTYAEVKVAENQSAGIILAAWENNSVKVTVLYQMTRRRKEI